MRKELFVPHPTQSKFSEQPSALLRNVTEEYKINRSLNQLTPKLVTKYWQENLKSYGSKADLNVVIPQYNGSKEELKTLILNGLEPVPVPTEVTGPEAVSLLRSMYREKIRIPYSPVINNTTAGWRHVVISSMTEQQLKDNFKNSSIQPMDLPTYIIFAAHMKDTTGHFPDELKLNNNINTSSRLAGTLIDPGLSVNENRDTHIPSVYFTQSGLLTITPIHPRDKFPDLTNRFQASIKPRKIA